MAGGNASKIKGSAGERQVCKLLGQIFEGSFIRSPNSGAYIGGKNIGRKETLSQRQAEGLKGDIVVPDTMPKFLIECKFYKEFPYHQFLSPGRVALLDSWIEQTVLVKDTDDFWVVIFKANRRNWCVVFDNARAESFVLPENHVRYANYIVCDMEDFFTRNKDAIIAITA